MQRDKQSPLELIKYTGYIQESFGRMRVRVVVVVVGERETPLEFYNITICLQTGGWRRRPSASIFFVFFVFFVSCVGVKEQLEAALVKT